MNRRVLPVRVRLSLIFTVLSIAGMTIVFLLTFFSLYKTLQSEDLDEMRSRLLAYWAQFQTGGIELLRDEINVDNLVVGERPFFVRLSSRENETLLFSYPEGWSSFRFDRLDSYDIDPGQILVLASSEYDYTIEIGGLWLSDDYYLQLGLATRTRVRLLTLFKHIYLLIAGGVVIIGFVIGLVVASRALSPISHINRTVREIIETGSLDARVPEPNAGGEMNEMAHLFNSMLERLQKLMEGMKNTVDMVAHDLRTPVTRLHATAELALGSESPDDLRSALEETQLQSVAILRIVNTLLEITRAESGVIELKSGDVDLSQIMSQVQDVYSLIAEDKGVELKLQAAPGCTIRADGLRIQQAVANLVDNAIKYTPAGGRVEMRCLEKEDEILIEISDTGCGLTDEECDRVWERMYRGAVQPDQEGLGLGLSFVKAVVEAHGGKVDVESNPGAGSTFRIVMSPAT